MPSFSSLLKHSRRNSQQVDRDNNGANQDNDTSEKIQQRQSKREFFRSLLKRSSLSPESRAGRRRSAQMMTPNSLQVPSPKSEKATTPMADPNKPLPPPPPDTIQAEPTPRPTKNLERIIAPITLPDLHKLFSGAPQFFARSEGHQTGAPHPSVAFPWDVRLDIRDLSDHVQIQDEAWSSVTAWPHIIRGTAKDPAAAKEHHEKQRAHFLPRCRERPNMLSMQGIERGTIGYQAALEMEVADALQVPEETASDKGIDSISERRKKFLNGKDGVRPLNDSSVIDRLVDVSTSYHEDPLKHRRATVELYTELFTQILFPPSRVTDVDDPYSLQVQIEVLVHVLASPVIWVDFSMVEWRIRLGQILWGLQLESNPEDEIAANSEVMHEPGTQKYWLLLQILLSCELLMRLDAVSSNIEHGLEEAKPAEIHKFDKNATKSVKWSLILARCWLENIQIEKTQPNPTSERKTGWLASLTGAGTTKAMLDDGIHNAQFHGRHQTRQLSGLLHFARMLKWPNVEGLSTKVSSNGITISDSAQSTPTAGTPLSISTERSSSYFANRRPGLRRGISTKKLSALIHPSGWLSNSYVSGLILPGEGLSHFLISTLLENDDVAVSKLGEEANLYGGFTYGSQSFWSKSCIVGRVLAAGKGASECMGWIASDIVPRGSGEAWVDIDVVHCEDNEDNRKARIWQKRDIEREGNVIGGADPSSVLPGDFIIPPDETSQRIPTVKLESLDFFAAVDYAYDTQEATLTKDTPTPLSDSSEALKIQTYSAMMRFSMDSHGAEKKEINLALTHDAQFVTAHPCVSSHRTEVLKSPTSASFHSHEQGTLGSPEALSSHPLHKAFTYTKIPISSLVFTPSSLSFSSLLSPPQSSTLDPTQSSTHTTNSNIPKVLVIDCIDSTTTSLPPLSPSSGLTKVKDRYFGTGSDLEILARALCAERGWNALVSRKGRGCLACAVREAGALGWKVVLRFA